MGKRKARTNNNMWNGSMESMLRFSYRFNCIILSCWVGRIIALSSCQAYAQYPSMCERKTCGIFIYLFIVYISFLKSVLVLSSGWSIGVYVCFYVWFSEYKIEAWSFLGLSYPAKLLLLFFFFFFFFIKINYICLIFCYMRWPSKSRKLVQLFSSPWSMINFQNHRVSYCVVYWKTDAKMWSIL